jgi:hypothetical protein
MANFTRLCERCAESNEPKNLTAKTQRRKDRKKTERCKPTEFRQDFPLRPLALSVPLR